MYVSNADGTLGRRAGQVTAQGLAGAARKEMVAAAPAGKGGGTAEGSNTAAVTSNGAETPRPPPPDLVLSESYDFAKYQADVRSAARAAGGWFNFILGGGEMSRLSRSISRWAGYDEDDLSPGHAKAVQVIRSIFGYNEWADMMCRSYLQSEEGSTFMSRTGYTSVDITGEREYVEPCKGIPGVSASTGNFTLPNGTQINCNPFHIYRISGEAVPGEVAMEFDVYLSRDGTGKDFDEGQDLHLYYDEETDEYLKVSLNRSGTRWSLSGPNMFIYEAYELYDKACIKFTERTFGNMINIMAMPAWDWDDMNPYCNTIKDAYASQTYAGGEESRRTGGGIPTPSAPTAGGATPGSGGIGPGAG